MKPKREARTAGARRAQGGFTLIELMLALVILALVMSMIYRIFTSQERMFRTQEQVAEMQENLRSVTEFINQEMSWIGYKVGTVAVAYASSTEIIYRANIPNTGTTLSWVRYRFDAANDQIWRAAGYTLSEATNDANLRPMASEIDNMTFEYFNVDGARVHIGNATPPADWSWARGSALGGPHDPTLRTVQRIRTTIVVRAMYPDWNYTHPTYGDAYRRRTGIIDVKARNLEDISLSGTGVGVGACSQVALDMPATTYVACPDKVAEMNTPMPLPVDLGDNPLLAVVVTTPAGSTDTVNEATLSADNGYLIYDNLGSFDNLIRSGESLYLTAGPVSTVSEGTVVTVTASFRNDAEVGCLATSVTDQVQIISAPAVGFDPAYSTGGLEVSYITLADGNPISPQPSPEQVAMCTTTSGEGVRFKARLLDGCGNAIEGQTVSFAAPFGGFATGTQVNPDGTYEIVYLPPTTTGAVSPSQSMDVTATWNDGAADHNLTKTLNLVPSRPFDIVVDSITEFSGSGLFGFSSTAAPNNGSSFSIERIDDQEVEVRFHLEDACGNRVFGQAPNLAVTASVGALGTVSEDAATGILSFLWKSNVGCGGTQSGNTLTLTASSIAPPGNAVETIGFVLTETTQGPRVIVDVDAPAALKAGNTSSSVVVRAGISKFFPSLGECVNVPGPFPVTFEVASPSPLRSGSFSATDFLRTSSTTTSDSTGLAALALYSGTAHWDDLLTVRATADLTGATFTGTNNVPMEASAPGPASGFYRDGIFSIPVGTDKPVRAFTPGAAVYVQIHDFDENESPLNIDSVGPPRVHVTLTSLRTGDSEVVNLTESNTNTALFRGNIATVSGAVAAAGDGVLQVRSGDTITMSYSDKDEPAEVGSWSAFTTGPDWMRLYKVVGGVETQIIPGPGQIDVLYGDQIRPRLHFPQYEGDGLTGAATLLTMTFSSGIGGDEDTVTMRESTIDSGQFIPNNAARTVALNTAPSPDAVDQLYIPYTPKTVTATYPAPLSPIEQLSFLMKDADLPDVAITSPGPLAAVNGDVSITVNSQDTNNAAGAITQVRLYLNGFLMDTSAGADLSGDTVFTWSTVAGGQPVWLDGTHTLLAEAVDAAGNVRTSLPVDVHLANGLSPIWFDYPGFGDVFSQGVNVLFRTSSLDTSALTYTVVLSVEGDDRAPIDLGGGSYTYNLDTTTLGEGPRMLTARILDSRGNLQETSLSIVVDRTPPSIGLTDPVPAFLNGTNFPLTPRVTAADTNGVDPSTVMGTFDGACTSLPNMPLSDMGSDQYQLLPGWDDPACAGKEGTISFTVTAADMASPANVGTFSVSTNIDTQPPRVTGLTVSPLQSGPFSIGAYSFLGFVRGPVDVQVQVQDAWPQSGNLGFSFEPDPWFGGAGMWWQAYGPFDATSGSYGYAWATTGERAPAMFWDNGFFTVYAFDALDQAGNLGTNYASARVYVDNGVPWADPPWPSGGWPIRGMVNMNYWANANYGFVREITHRIFPANANTGDPAQAVWSTTLSWPIDSTKYTVNGTYDWDSKVVPDGEYWGFGYGRDHAGNESVPGWYSTMRVFNKYMPSVAATYQDIGGPRYRVNLTGSITHPTFGPAGGQAFFIQVERYDSLGNYIFGNTYWDPITMPDGTFSYDIPQTDFTFDPGDRLVVQFFSQPEGFPYGVLGASVPGAPVFFRATDEMANPGYAFVSMFGFGQPYSLQVTGEFRDSLGNPVPGMGRVYISHYTPTWTYLNGRSYDVAAGPTGTFSLDVPTFDFTFNDGDNVYIDFYNMTGNWQGYFWGTVPGPLTLWWN